MKLQTCTKRAVKIVEDFTGMTKERMFLKKPGGKYSRQRDRVMARAYVYLILRHFNKWTLQAIGDEFHVDHGTVLHSLKLLNDLYESSSYQRVQMTQMLQRAVKLMGVKGV